MDQDTGPGIELPDGAAARGPAEPATGGGLLRRSGEPGRTGFHPPMTA